MQAHEEKGERVDEARRCVLTHRQGKQRAVGEGELQVLGDESRVEFLALGGLAARDDGDRLDGRGVQPLQVTQAVVLVMGDRRTDLLDREHATGQIDEAHDVAGNAAGQCREQVGRPLLEGNIPREVQKGGVDCSRRNVQCHENHYRISNAVRIAPTRYRR